ncbi:MAG: helix-turn-helix transcriptional regulator [Gammaproteobacteria bacterium]|nr:helix-turn-helix transcriptional regulator [Gammaproteobacteria bacterium]
MFRNNPGIQPESNTVVLIYPFGYINLMVNLVKILRSQTGLTQQGFAARVQTSQSTVAAYETESKSPTIRTVNRFTSLLGLELVASFAPAMSREDRRSLEFHKAIACKLRNDPRPAVNRAEKNLRNLLQLHPHADALLLRWKSWLNQPTDDLVARILDTGLLARDMRQISPFSGILNPQERSQILKKFRKAYDR